MSIRVALPHETAYRYDRPVILSPQPVPRRAPPRCVHPTIPGHTPTVFDEVGGCVHLVGRPGGRNDETFPVNSHEADARRSPLTPVMTESPDAPSTLDLRRHAAVAHRS